MKTRFPILAVPCLGLAILFTACLDNAAPTSAGDEGGANAAASDGTTPIFTESFADGGTLRVVSDEAGRIQYLVQAPIGSKAERLLTQGAQEPNLAGVYRTLHEGGRAVPAELQKVSDRLEALKNMAPIREAAEPAPEALAKSAQSAASPSDPFMQGYCRDFLEGGILYRKNGCGWSASSNWVETSANLRSDGWIMDRSYGWNATGWTATMNLTASTWKPTIPPYYVNWIQWGGVYSGARATLRLPAGKWGEIAITSHRATRIL